MGFIYRYIDLTDETIKYVGNVYGRNRSLKKRIEEHLKRDVWCWNAPYRVDFIENDWSRTDLEYLESHFISLYSTWKYYNKAKTKWGVSDFIPDIEEKWKYYGVINENLLNEQLEKARIEAEKAVNQKELFQKILNFMKCQQNQTQMYRQLLENN